MPAIKSLVVVLKAVLQLTGLHTVPRCREPENTPQMFTALFCPLS